MADSWPMAHVMAGMSAVPVGHAIDLAFFFPVEDRARHDALIAETRRHLGGCLTAIETALRLSLAGDPAIAAALGQRRFLLFAALAGRRLRLGTAQVTDILIMGPVMQVATLCRALGGTGADYRHLLLALRPVRPGLSDAVIVAEADQYQLLSDVKAEAVVGALRAPAAFRAKLDHLRRVTG